jgi:transcriptional regulator NrdR family protein
MCPECGAGRGLVIQNGYDDLDRVLRLRRCKTCNTQYCTAEVPVPGSFYQLADSWRLRQLQRARLVRGYHNTASGRYRRKRQRLEIEVKVKVA